MSSTLGLLQDIRHDCWKNIRFHMNVPGHIEGCEILSEEVSQYFGLTFAFITTIAILPIHNKIDLAPNLIVHEQFSL